MSGKSAQGNKGFFGDEKKGLKNFANRKRDIKFNIMKGGFAIQHSSLRILKIVSKKAALASLHPLLEVEFHPQDPDYSHMSIFSVTLNIDI
jgi:hypothetical protein